MKKIQSLFISMLFISLVFFATGLTAQEAGIDFDFSKEPLDKVIGFLIEAYNMPIAYQDQQIRGITITATCQDCSQDQAIRKILQSTPISAYQFKTQIILTKDKAKRPDGERNRIIGRIIDAREGSSLPYANILVKEYKKGTSSDLHGEFILEDLPAESFVLKVLYIGYKEKEQLVNGPLTGQDTLTIALNEDYLESDTIAVLGKRPYPIRTGEQVGKTSLDVARLNNIPSISNAPLENAVSIMPGISAGFEVPTQFSFYGGRYDQNLFLLDDIPFYRPYHYFGLISAFHPRAIERADVYKGVFPVRFDNCRTGVIDATVNTVPENRFNWGLDSDLFGFGGFIEGPLNNRFKYFLAARHSWSNISTSSSYYKDLVFFAQGYNTFVRDALDDGIPQRTYFQPTRFYDLLGKTLYKVSDDAQATVTFYYGRDLQGPVREPLVGPDGNVQGILKLTTYNENAGLSSHLNYDWSRQFHSTLTWVYHHTLDHIEEKQVLVTDKLPNDNDKLSQQSLQLESNYADGNWRYEAGIKWLQIGLRNQFDYLGSNQLDTYNGWVQINWQPRSLDITAGIHMKDIYEPLNFSSHLALGWQILNNMKLTAGWGQYKQYDGQVNYYDTFITFNNYNRLHNRKLTVLLNRDRNPTTYTKDSENFVIGLHSSLFGLQIDANTWYRSSSVSLYADYFYEELNYHYSQIDGIVYAAGFDISLRKQYGIYQGQLSYTRSSLKYKFGYYSEPVNDGKAFNYNLNRDHQLTFIGHVKLESWDLALSEIWASPTRDLAFTTEVIPNLPRGVPHYNRMDLSIQKSGLQIMDLYWTFKAGVLNVFNRPNIRLKVPFERSYDNITYGLARTFYAGLQVSLH